MKPISWVATRAAAIACVASPKMKTRLPVRYVESTEREYHGERDSASGSWVSAGRPASCSTSAMKALVAPTPIGMVFVNGWPKKRCSQPATCCAVSG